MQFQAMTTGSLTPWSKMTTWQWKESMLRGCDMIDDFLRDLERPVINPAVKGKWLPRVSDGVPLLAKAARRNVEVLVYAGNKWWRQGLIDAGTVETKIHLGTDKTQKGTKFTTYAITTEEPLTRQTYTNLPDFRTKSDEITLIRL
jgi:hypothetical protein